MDRRLILEKCGHCIYRKRPSSICNSCIYNEMLTRYNDSKDDDLRGEEERKVLERQENQKSTQTQPEDKSVLINARNNKCRRCGKNLSPEEIVKHYTNEDNSPENLMILCEKCHSKLHDELQKTINKFTGLDDFEMAANNILSGLRKLGFETDDNNFKDTPKRFARAYYEIFEGCINTQKQIDDILATSFPSNGCNDMVIAKDIVCFSMCPHHLLPVEYHVCVGYIPAEDGKVLGISKLARLVEVLAKRPALQESFTHEIVDQLHKIGAQGAIAVVEGQHMCMRMRGAKATTTSITTTAIEGLFKTNPAAKQEFFENIKDRIKFR